MMDTLSKLLNFSLYPNYARKIWWKIITTRQLTKMGVQIGDNVQIQGQPIVSMQPHSQILIGAHSVLCSDSRYTALGINHPVVLRTLRPGARIHIKEHAGISGATICAAMEINIGRHVLLGANVTIVDTDFHSLKANDRRYNRDPNDIAASPVDIADNVFVGSGAIILKGVSIGANSIIGAGAIVVHDIPANAIAAGNPAKIIGQLP
jgi:acetyltransferase-like isoleucine patch superfamily enzyme